jgi:hypothetical protein
VTVKNAVFSDIKPQFLPYRRHITSPLESNGLRLRKIWGFHGGDYEERRLLGYKNPVRTSQETHCVSATEPSRLLVVLRFDVFTAVTMKNAVFWDIKPSSYLAEDALHLRYIAQPVNAMQDLRFSRRRIWKMPSPGMWHCVSLIRTDVSGESYPLHHQGDKMISLQRASVASYCYLS